ncbi:DUF192 domain-containing protein [Peredibacter sp. HCB2-198]|uniref:DUF192 domain-containing protein n=1 Tax=Peredibacter sp. HCB2-198 TaxID=3383025 RepID=UPI0038B5F54B
MNKFFILCLLFFFISCGDSGSGSSSSPSQEPETTTEQDPLKEVDLVTPQGETVKTSLAYTKDDQLDGLQHVQDSEFSEDQGKLFFYLKDAARTFWMPNTYFNLDIIYLDEDLKIVDIVWNMPHYTDDLNSEIPRAPTITSRHVLEMKAGSPASSQLKIGDSLKWNSSLTLDQAESSIKEELNND